MVDSRNKGARAEYDVRDSLRDRTSLKWERVPGSGGLNSVHGLKGDVYVPGMNIRYCVEVKHYKDDTINHLLIKNPDNTFAKFWAQTVRESEQVDKEPLLVFKKDRGHWMVATREAEAILPELIYINEFRENKHLDPIIGEVRIYSFNDWLNTKDQGDFL